MKIALIGATGLVGTKMIQVLEESGLSIAELIPVASEKSIGKSLVFNGKSFPIVGLDTAVNLKPDFALFSAGGGVSLEWAPKFAEQGTIVVDNSSAWRMNPEVPLVVPEINADAILEKHKIIANPNCSTIQLVMALAPLHRAFGLERVVISTYQSVTGTGVKAVNQMENERKGIKVEDPAYLYQIDRNCIPHCDVFEDNGYTKEEMKLVNETRKILASPEIKITATAVRVPVTGGHSESVNAGFKKPFSILEVRDLLSQTPGVVLSDDIQNGIYPMPLTANEKDAVFVGRLRMDDSFPNTLNMWIVADNLRKGAATNAVQIIKVLSGKVPSSI